MKTQINHEKSDLDTHSILKLDGLEISCKTNMTLSNSKSNMDIILPVNFRTL